MPRIRTIKPEFWTSAQILECSTNARLLFIGLWNFADDAGRHPNSLKQIKAEVFPADDFTLEDIHGMLNELSENDLILRYEVDGKGFLAITGWHHQRIDKPQPPKYPGPDDERSKIIPGTIPPDRKGKEGIGKEGIGKEGIGKERKGEKENQVKEKAAADSVQTVFDHWREVTGHGQAKLDSKRERLICNALKLGYSVEELQQAITGYTLSPHHTGDNDKGTKYNQLGLILRDAEHVDQGLSFYRNPPKLKGKQSRIEAINRQAVEEFLRDDDPLGFEDKGEVIEGEAKKRRVT